MLEEIIGHIGHNSTIWILSQPSYWTITKPTLFDRFIWFVTSWQFLIIVIAGLAVWLIFKRIEET